LKIALDEHIGQNLVEALKALSGEAGMLRVELVSARNYSGNVKAASDIPWLEKFAKDGGTVVVSGDMRMRGKLHEQRALRDAGFVVFFPARQWNNFNVHNRAAFLIRWWPFILKQAKSSTAGRFYEIPISWTSTEMKEVTPPARQKPGRKKAENEDEHRKSAGNRSIAPHASDSTDATQASQEGSQEGA